MTNQPTQRDSRNRAAICTAKRAGLRFENARFAPPHRADIETSSRVPFETSRISGRFGRLRDVEPIRIWLRQREGA